MKITDYAISPAPPIPAFDAVTTTDDLEAVIELEGWTNDLLVSPRLARRFRS